MPPMVARLTQMIKRLVDENQKHPSSVREGL